MRQNDSMMPGFNTIWSSNTVQLIAGRLSLSPGNRMNFFAVAW